ncbi:MAG: RHS repeat protein, partial [bacterium]|nr:RHS repeat protein [bacterium]
WQVGLALRGFTEGEIGIAGENGNQLFVFDDRGRHLRTVHALTGADILRFRYDADGLLTEIETGDGLITTVQRDAAGRPTAVVAPFGQVLELDLGTGGYLETTRNPAGETRSFTYDHLGRLKTFTDRLGRETTASYDSFGRLLSETDPGGGFKQFSREALGRTTTQVTMQTAEGRETRYETQRGRSFVRSTVSRPDGLPRTTTAFANGASVLSRPDDSQASATVGPDPRFGMQTPVAESQQLTLPSGLSWSSSFERSVELSDLNDPLSLESILDTVTVNGRSYTREYLAQERTLVRRSPEGRQSSTR